MLLYIDMTSHPKDTGTIRSILLDYFKRYEAGAFGAADLQQLVTFATGEAATRGAQSAHLAWNMAWHAMSGFGDHYYPDRMGRDLAAVRPSQLTAFLRNNMKNVVIVEVRPPDKAPAEK